MSKQNHDSTQGSALDITIAKALSELSYIDQNAINEEIHGVRCLAAEETPEMLRTSLNSFQSQLNAMPPSKKEVYKKIVGLRQKQQKRKQQQEFESYDIVDQASSSSNIGKSRVGVGVGMQMQNNNTPVLVNERPHEFIDDEIFRLRFLRCELFDIQKAITRFISYLDLSYELFGEVALKRPIRISDLSKSELRFIRKGFLQVLPYPDRAGRRVVVLLGGLTPDIDTTERVSFLYKKDYTCSENDSQPIGKEEQIGLSSI